MIFFARSNDNVFNDKLMCIRITPDASGMQNDYQLRESKSNKIFIIKIWQSIRNLMVIEGERAQICKQN